MCERPPIPDVTSSRRAARDPGRPYQVSELCSPERSRGVRWNDPAFGIPWPEDDRPISDRDSGYLEFSAAPGRRVTLGELRAGLD